MATHPFLAAPRPHAIAHRGGAAGGAGAENTMSAFATAVDLGYRYVETDVHITGDGVVVACHDATLARIAGLARSIAKLTWTELASIELPGGGQVPTLASVLDRWPDLRVNIDLKAGAAIEATAQVITRTGALDRVCLASFSQRRLARIRSLLGAEACTALGPAEVAALRVVHRFAIPPLRPRITGHCVQVPERIGAVRVVDRRLVARAHSLGLAVHVWTVNDRVGVARLLDLGVDGIMTDDLPMLRDELISRGQWSG